MAKVQIIGQKAMNMILKDKDGVQDAVHDKAEEIGQRAELRLSGHRRTGAANVLVKRGDVDSYVILDDDAAMSIEFGHWYTNGNGEPKYVPGLYIITGAAGLV